MTEVGIFALGVVSGAVFGVILVRYGIGLGFKAIFQAKEDVPISSGLSEWGSGSSEPIEQSYTSGELEAISPNDVLDEIGIPNGFPIKQRETM